MEIKNHDRAPDGSSSVAFYRNVKVKFNAFMDRIIQRCNVILGKEEDFRQTSVKTNILKLARFIGSLALLLQQLPRAEAFDVIGPDGRVVYFGTQHGADTFQDLYHESKDSHPQAFGRFNVWSLPFLTRQWLSAGAQMVVCEFSPLFPFRFGTAFVVPSPVLIEQEIISLPENLDDLYNQSNFRVIRQKLNRSQRRADFKSYFTRERSDFDLYYQKMYLPYITKRHGKAAAISTYDGALENFTHGGLVMVTEDQKSVAGMLVVSKEKICFGLEAGVLDGDKDLFRKEVYTFNLWSVLEWANQQGLTSVNMGAGSAWRSNGVFAYKNDWGTRVRCFRAIQSNLFYLMDNPSQEFLEQLNQKGIITEEHSGFYGVIFTQKAAQRDDEWLEKELRSAVEDGLSGILVVSPNSKVFYDGEV